MNANIKSSVCEMLLEQVENPNLTLTEVGIAERLGTSRTPVREVIQHLKLLGVIDSRKKRGIFLKDMSIKEFADTFDVRAALEGLGGRLAAGRAGDDDVKELGEILADYERALAMQDLKAIDRTEYAFHGKILAVSENDFLIKIVNDFFLLERSFLLERVFVLDRVARSGPPVTFTPNQSTPHTHAAIFEAFRRRDPDACEAELRGHILDSKKTLVEQITGLRIEN